MVPKTLVPLLVSAGILLAGNGMQITLVAVRAGQEGFPPSLIGLMGTLYFAGYIVSCLVSARLIARAGHIRVFAALSALAAVGALIFALVVEPLVWLPVRLVMGFCFAGLFMVMESWLNSEAEESDRGRVLSIYRLVDLSAVTASQLVLPLIGTMGYEAFSVVAILFCLALLPISLSRGGNPRAPASPRLRLGHIWSISPVGCLGCTTIGLTNSAFRNIGPIYAQEIGFDVEGVALFMTAGIVGGALAQYPLGWLSDKINRRNVLIGCTLGAAAAGGLLAALTGSSAHLIYLGAFLFGASALPLYSISIAHANDRAGPGDYVELSAGLILFFSLGAAVGPFFASLVLQHYGAPGFFIYTSLLHLAFLVFVAYRITRRAAVPRELKTRFEAFMRTSPAIFRLARRGNGTKVNGDG